MLRFLMITILFFSFLLISFKLLRRLLFPQLWVHIINSTTSISSSYSIKIIRIIISIIVFHTKILIKLIITKYIISSSSSSIIIIINVCSSIKIDFFFLKIFIWFFYLFLDLFLLLL